MKENEILARVRLALGRMTKIFRNNSGTAWQGKIISQDGEFLVLKDPRPIKFGVCNPGGSDLIGWTPYKIKQTDINRTVAVFTAIETKTQSGRVSPEQQNFLGQVITDGGIAGVARTPEDAKKIVSDWGKCE